MDLEDGHCGPSKEKLQLLLFPLLEMLLGGQQEEGVGDLDRVHVFFDSQSVPFVSCALSLSLSGCTSEESPSTWRLIEDREVNSSLASCHRKGLSVIRVTIATS
jgi:hypothetical protein